MSPTIMIIRHGEKPAKKLKDPFYGLGLTETGAPDNSSLVVHGWQRAGAWAALFGDGRFAPDYPKPGVVYAANPNATPTDGDDSISKRPWETIVPLCGKLGSTPVTTHGVGDEAGLVAEVTQLEGVVFICWEHKKIGQAIVPALTNGPPLKWDHDRFDVVLKFTLSGANWTYVQLFPRLLAGDLATPLGQGSE